MKKAFFMQPLIPTLSLQIADRISGGIRDEYFTPGERLKEVALADMFQVSRATVREALRILENRGLVSIVPQRGARVTTLSAKELEDLFEIRAALLGLASRRLARVCTPEVAYSLRTKCRALQATVHDATLYARESANLVAEIVQSGGNLLLKEHIVAFGQRIDRYRRLGLSSPERRKQSLSNWVRLIDSIVRHDGVLAESIHQRLATENMMAGLSELRRRELEARGSRKRQGGERAKRKQTDRSTRA